jgi:hypothetical protein
MINQKVPVFCEKCHILALANLENMPLCSSCLAAAVKSSGDPYLFDRITPLFISRSDELKGGITSRKRGGVAAIEAHEDALKP